MDPMAPFLLSAKALFDEVGMDSKQVVARFEAERQALAMMDHINIARVCDGGTTEASLPYFVMELVDGVPITKYCEANPLTPRKRLELSCLSARRSSTPTRKGGRAQRGAQTQEVCILAGQLLSRSSYPPHGTFRCPTSH